MLAEEPDWRPDAARPQRFAQTQAGISNGVTGLAARQTDSSPTARRLDGSTARRLDGSTARRLDGSTARRLDGSTARRLDDHGLTITLICQPHSRYGAEKGRTGDCPYDNRRCLATLDVLPVPVVHIIVPPQVDFFRNHGPECWCDSHTGAYFSQRPCFGSPVVETMRYVPPFRCRENLSYCFYCLRSTQCPAIPDGEVAIPAT